MAYSEQTWNVGVAGGTPVNVPRLQHMEDGIAAAAVLADIGTSGTATGDALRAAFVSAILPEKYGAHGDGTTNDTAALSSAITAAAGSGHTVVLTGNYAFTSLALTLDNVSIMWLPGATLTCTLDKTTDTIPFQLTGSHIALHNPTMTFATAVNIDTDAATRPANADAFRLGGASSASLADDIRVTGGTANYARNSGLRIRFATRVRVRAFEVYESLGNGVMVETCQNARVTDCVTDRTGDDGIVALSGATDYANGLSKNVTIVGNQVRRTYGNGINLTGVSVGMVADNIITSTFAPGIHLWQDSGNGFGTCDNITLGTNTIKGPSTYFGAGQFKTAAYSAPAGVYISGSPTNIVLLPQNISGSQGGDYTILSGSVMDFRPTATPLRTSANNFVQTSGVTGTTTAAVAGTLTFVPIVVPATVVTKNLYASVITAAAGATVRVGIYANANGGPGALIAEGDSTIDASTTGVKSTTITQTLPPGSYWLAAVAQGGTPSLRTLVGRPPGMTGNSDPGASMSGWSQTGVTAALPATAVTTGVTPTAIGVNLGI